MFTGVIIHLGILKRRDDSTFTIEADKNFCNQLKKFSSVAVNGVSFTITNNPSTTSFNVEVTPEILKRSMLGKLKENDIVNLEIPLTLNALLSGHLVRGAVEATGRVAAIRSEENSRIITVTLPELLHSYIVTKGPIALNGISLTVVDSMPTYFTVSIANFTWENTMLHRLKVGDLINIETDIFAKYAHQLIKKSIKNKHT